MKAFSLIAALMAVASMAQTAVADVVENRPDWINFARYEGANKQLLDSVGADPDRVVFMGNSITQFWFERRPDFVKAHPHFVGRGIGGQTTYQFLGRFREDVINLKPALVVINAATNDIGENTHVYSEERTFGNIVSLVELARANGIKVIMSTTLPAVKYRWNPTVENAPDKVTALNKRLREYAQSQGIPFVDYYSAMVMADGSRAMDPKYSYDGIHPTAEGYEVMEGLIVPVIDQVMGKKM